MGVKPLILKAESIFSCSECLAEHIVKVTAIQMIGCSQRLRLGIEDDASLRAVVPHLDLHTAVAGSGREKKAFCKPVFPALRDTLYVPFSYKYSPVSIGCIYGYKFSAEVRYWKVSSRGPLPADNVLFAQCSLLLPAGQCRNCRNGANTFCDYRCRMWRAVRNSMR